LRGRALAILAMTLVSCSTRLVPASTPLPPVPPLRLVVTPPVAELVNSLTTAYSRLNPGIHFDMILESERAAADAIQRDPGIYWFTQHLDDARDRWAAPIGQDGIALIAHPGIGVRDLTLAQVRGLYDGTITRWRMVGGADTPVIAFTREAGAGIYTAIVRQVLGTARLDSSVRIAPSDAAMRFAVERTPGAVGYLPISTLTDRLTPLRLEGVAPTRESVVAQSYPLRLITYIVGAAEPRADDPIGRHYRAFIGWMQSPEGQAIVSAHGAPLPG